MQHPRSTVLDSFTVDQMRVMKVGGNLNATEHFKQFGASFIKDAKSKYTSKAALVYKEKLQKWVQEDKQRWGLLLLLHCVFFKEINSRLNINPKKATRMELCLKAQRDGKRTLPQEIMPKKDREMTSFQTGNSRLLLL
jgi:hypothetical protein